MAEKCFICGEELKVDMDGVARCKNGHEKKTKPKHYTYPLGENAGDYRKKIF